MYENFLHSGTDVESAEKATEKLQNKDVALFVITGKLASGKDTIAPLVMEGITNSPVQKCYFAEALKKEVSEVIAYLSQLKEDGIITQSGNNVEEYLRQPHIESIRYNVSLVWKIKEDDAQVILESLIPAVLSANPPKDAWVRSHEVRKSLQYWGTDIRRTQDEFYWVNKTTKSTSKIIAEGFSVWLGDGRFPNEMDHSHGLSAFLSRIEISEETQRRRLFKRDGLLLTDDAKNHPSETALDNYPNFDVVVNNDVDDSAGSNIEIEKVSSKIIESYKEKM